MLAQTTNLNEPPAQAPEKERADYSIAIGVGCTILFHLLLVTLSPLFAFDKFSGVHSGINVNHNNRGKSFDFQLMPPPVKEKEPTPLNFVETNPDAPENTPDKTPNVSNRNQQSAQPDPAKEKDAQNRPSLKGQDEIKNESAIVTGDKSKPELGSQAVRDSTKSDQIDQQEQKARAEQVPLNGFEKSEGKSPDGIAMNVSKSKSPTTNADKSVEGAHEATDPNGGLVALPALSHAAPKERPRLTAPRPTFLNNRITGTANIGILGIDARWSEYGEYMNELIEIIDTQWRRILTESHVSPPRGSHAVVTFTINSKGETKITKVEDADAGTQGTGFCVSAITDPAPYRKWPEQMIAVLGDEQTITFSFYYQ